MVRKVSLVERMGEEVVRRSDRRDILRKAAVTAFAIATAWAVDLAHPGQAIASGCATDNTSCPNNYCNPPGGLYCNTVNSGYCNGYTCAGGCSPSYSFYPNSNGGCWCTSTCSLGGVCNDYGYYYCCDCNCPHGVSCGCSQLVITTRNPECMPG